MPENEVKTVPVPEHQLEQLLAQLDEYKIDIVALVSVFKQFETLFSGKASMVSVIPVVTKLLSNKNAMAELAHIVPIIEKYSQPENNG